MHAPPQRLVFAGTPDFAAEHLRALIAAGFNVVSAYSQPDRPSGRGKLLLPTPVKALALEHGIPVYQPLAFDAAEQASLAACQADVMVVVAYGLLLPPAVLATPRQGCINVHASLLPRWRGAAPIERAIMAGDAHTGVCIMQMEAGLDTGPVLQRVSTPILPADNSKSLTERLCELGCAALCSALPRLSELASKAVPQDEALATYARKINKSEALINWQWAARDIHNLARALYPRVPAYCLHLGKRLRIVAAQPLGPGSAAHDASGKSYERLEISAVPAGTVLACSSAGLDIRCGEGVLRVLKVQLEGKNEMDLASLLNGYPDAFPVGMNLGSEPS